MLENTTISMLFSFSKGDWDAFGHFLESPLFKTKKVDIALYKALRKGMDRGKGKLVPDKQVLFSSVFPSKPYDSHTLNKAMSSLNGHIRAYWACCQIHQDPTLQQEALIRFHAAKGEIEAYKKNIAEMAKTLEKQPESGDLYIERIRYQKQYIAIERNPERLALGKDILAHLLETHYLLLKVQFACFELGNGQNSKVSQDMTPYQTLRTQLIPFEAKSALLRLYGLLLDFLLAPSPDLQDYKAFMTNLPKTALGFISKEELEGIVRNFQNILIVNISKAPQAGDILGDLYHWAFKAGAWGPNMPFTNVIYIMAKNKRWAKTEELLTKYQETTTSHQDNDNKVLALAEGIIAFFRDQYTRCLKHLEAVTHLQDERLILQAHAVRVRAAYELFVVNRKNEDMEQALKKTISAFGLFLKRSKALPQNRIKEHEEFVDILQAMAWPQNRHTVHLMLEGKQPAMQDWLLAHMSRLPPS